MFSGTYTPKLDEKGRLFLPAKFRDEMREGLVITRGQEHALDIRTQADFAVFTEKFKNASQTDARTAGLRPDAVRAGLRAGSRQAGPRHHHPRAAAVRRARAGRRGDRRSTTASRSGSRAPGPTYTADQEQAFANLQEEIFPGF